MAPDKSTTILSQLAALTADLKPAYGISTSKLHEARVTVASALASADSTTTVHLPDSALAAPSIEDISLDDHLQAAISQSSKDIVGSDSFTIVRRTTPIPLPGISSLTPDVVAGQAADLSFGPFLDAFGRPVWIDLFRIVRQVKLVRVAGGTPFLTIPVRGLLIKPINSDLTLGPGSVWMASATLAPGAPANGFTGLLIHGGSLHFSSPLPHSGLEIVAPAAVTCTLNLDLDPGAGAPGTGAGEDARVSVANLPGKATFKFSAAGAAVSAVSPGSAQLYGSTVDIAVSNGPATFNPVTNQVVYAAATTAKTFAAKDVRSDQFQPAGSAAIDGVGWALPISITSAGSLGTASGAGSLGILTNAGLTFTWKGQPKVLPATNTILLLSPGLITVIPLGVLGLGARQTIPLWSATPGGPTTSQATLRWTAPFALRFTSSSSGVEILFLPATFDGDFDRPITVTGRRVYAHSAVVFCLFIESPVFNGVIIEGLLQAPPVNPNAPLGFAIQNAVFRTTHAVGMILVAFYDGASSKAGGLALGFGLQLMLPTLPDPYAANFSAGGRGRRSDAVGSVGIRTAIVQWVTAAKPTLTYLLPSLSSSSGLFSTTSAEFNNVAATSTGTGGGILLLDVSTNVDQFGVAWSVNQKTVGGLAVDAMFLASSGNSVAVITVPAVQWEPVYTEPAPAPPYPAGFPSPMTFPDNGGLTAIRVQTAKLVRIAPAPALDSLVGNFTTSAAPDPAIAQLTLPFGIRAFANLNKPAGPGSAGANVNYNRPNFTLQSVKGGYQISLHAVDPAFPDSPAFQGNTNQLLNGEFNGVPTGMSVLGPDVDSIFNPYLGAGGTRPMVPVTRLDLSGYGESLFSDWRNETNDITAVSKARFDVLIGRTAVEVVQVRSILYPYGVRVVRTITIDRKNTGVVARHDSGWQAASDGKYDFPAGTLAVHPGVVLHMDKVTNIRDTGQFVETDGVKLAGVYFDGSLVIDGVTKGAGADGVPARNQIGYVQLTPESSGGPLTALQYQHLIEKTGPMGGNVDCTIDVAGSGLPMRVGRVGVGVTEGMGGPEFVMTAWGSPQFPYGGQWSFLKQTAAGAAPGLVDTNLGVPLIRAGAAPAPAPPSSPYRFADPVDLATASNPQSDYGIVHATGTQRIFFPRPKIEASAPHQITSTVAPTLADPYSLANAVGLFPRTDSAIPFPNANYSLAISSTGNIKLQLPTPSFPVTVGQRTLSQAAGVRGYVDYAGSTAAIAIDTSAAVQWSFSLKGVSSATSTTLLGEVLRVVADVDAAANAAAKLNNPRLIFGSALAPVQGILAFLSALGFPVPLNVSMTNKLQLKVGLKIPMDKELNKLLPPGGPSLDDTDVVISFVIDSPLAEVDFELAATLLIPTPFDPLMAAGKIGVKIALSTASGTTFTLTVGAGLGVLLDLKIFKVQAYFLETMFFIVGDTVVGMGVGVLIKGTVDLEVVSVEVSVEAKMAILSVSCGGPQPTIYGVAQVTFAIDITICWIIDIDFEVQAEYDQNLNGGSCALPDVL